MLDRFLERSFQRKANKLHKRSMDMNIKMEKSRDQINKLRKLNKTHDPVTRPAHYNNGKVECIEYIKQQLGSGFPKYLEGSVIKYIHRHNMKHSNNIQDLEKARWYLDRLTEHYKNL